LISPFFNQSLRFLCFPLFDVLLSYIENSKMRTGFYKIDLNKTEWEVPDSYQMLSPVGSGAYGQVW
jgi:hypothetical protein